MSIGANIDAVSQSIFKTLKKVTMGNDDHYKHVSKMAGDIKNIKARKKASSFKDMAKSSDDGLVGLNNLSENHRKNAEEIANSKIAKINKKNKKSKNTTISTDNIANFDDEGNMVSANLDSVHSGYKKTLGNYRKSRNISAMQSGNFAQRTGKKAALVGAGGFVGYKGVKTISGRTDDNYYTY